MSSKRSKSKLSFKVFSANNYSQFASKFPFLKERQIKTKIQKSWRNKFTSGTTKNVGEIEKPKRGNETLVNGAESDSPSGREEDAVEKRSHCSPPNTYSVRRHNRKVQDDFAKKKPSETTGTANDLSPVSSVSNGSKMSDNKDLEEHGFTKRSKGNELIDLFDKINAEQLLIEPEDIISSEIEFMSSTPRCFNHQEWLRKLTEEVEHEKNTNTVSGMFKWRADGKRNNSQKKEEENRYESRVLVSSECEGSSNFVSMFESEEDIFL